MKKIFAILLTLVLSFSGFTYEYMKITDYEFFAKDNQSQDEYLVDLYDDFNDARINKELLIEKVLVNDDSLLNKLTNAECTVAKFSKFVNQWEKEIQFIFFIDSDNLYKATLKK